MTKNFKRILSAVLAVVMVFAMASFTAFAEDTYKITISDDNSSNVYVAYQILSADVATLNGEQVLSNIKKGSGVELLTEAPDGADSSWTAKSESEFIAFIQQSTEDNVEANILTYASLTSTTSGTGAYNSTDKTYDITGLTSGYYLVKNSSVADTGEAYTNYIIKVVGADVVNVEPKTDVPTVTKKVDDKNDSSTGEDSTTWEDSADYDIGDLVPFQLTGTLPSNISSYEDYSYTFHDKESAGLTFDPTTVKVTVGGTEISATQGENTNYTINENPSDDCTFEIVFTDVKSLYDADGNKIDVTSHPDIVVTYKSQLNSSAVVGYEGNPNEVYITFDNNPYGDGTGRSTTDKVTVFTFKLVVNKVDGDNTALAGAEFKLQKKNSSGTYEDVVASNDAESSVVKPTATKNDVGTTFTFTGLDAGDYQIVEVVTPSGYNTIDPIKFTIEAEHDATSDDPQLTSLVVKNSEGETISKDSDSESTDTTLTFTVTKTDSNYAGDINTNIQNLKGSELPETGGMGTKIFYTLGGILVVAAGILLITKRRMRNA